MAMASMSSMWPAIGWLRGLRRYSSNAVSCRSLQAVCARTLRQGSAHHFDTMEIEANIEHTQFPVPKDEQHTATDDFTGLLPAADLIGQLADINYLRKTAALFNEFRETGMSDTLKYRSAADLRANYPNFFWQVVRPYIEQALHYLRVTQEGKIWIATLYANVFSTEHRGRSSRPRLQRGVGEVWSSSAAP